MKNAKLYLPLLKRLGIHETQSAKEYFDSCQRSERKIERARLYIVSRVVCLLFGKTSVEVSDLKILISGNSGDAQVKPSG